MAPPWLDSGPLAALLGRLEPLWRRRRRLKATTAGRALIALTLAVGFAAFNTGNNLLFFGWGLLLSAIIVSGILSEATLQAVTVEQTHAGELRAQTSGTLPFIARNIRRVPAFAVEFRAALSGGADGRSPVLEETARSFELRLSPGTRRPMELHVSPTRRGTLRVMAIRALTAFPFGFFEKEKYIALDPPLELVVFPARVDMGPAAGQLLARLGESPARRAGPGDELFSLRPFRVGDDLRSVAWRRSARTHRLVVRETEATRSQDVVVEVVSSPNVDETAFDHAVDVAATLAEDLLAAGQAVGLRGPDVFIPPARSARQRSALLTRLALMDGHAQPAPLSAGRAVVIAVVPEGAATPAHASAVVHATRRTATVAVPRSKASA